MSPALEETSDGGADAVDRSGVVLVAAATALGLLVAVRLRPQTLYDDAAITFRYAQRLADGLGFTYNDGDRTGGASAPLYTLLLAAVARVGPAPDTVAAVVSVPLFGGVVGLATWLGRRLGGIVAGSTAAVVLLSGDTVRALMLSGMESALAAALGLGALVALSAGRPRLAAVLTGLAVVNRLDATGLAVAVLLAVWSTRRRPPVHEALLMAGVALPWFAFATWYFGSPVPFSATQKLAGRSGSWDQDPLWVLRAVTGRHGALVVVLAAGSVLLLHPRTNRSWRAGAHLALLTWLALHVSAYSALDLGAPYPWYTTVAFPLVAVGAGVSTAALIDGARRSGWIGRPGLLGAAVLVGLSLSLGPGVIETVAAVAVPPPERTTRLLDATLSDAGRFVAEQAGTGDVVRTCYGWVAYEAIELAVDEVCPLSTRREVPPATWLVESGGLQGVTPEVEGFREVATFSRTGPDGTVVSSSVYRRS